MPVITGQQISTPSEVTDKQPHMNSGAVAPGQEAPQADPKPAVDPLSAKFAAMARREKALRAERLSIEREREAMKSKAAEYESSYIPKSRLAEDPFSVLEEAGLSYDQLTQLALNNPNSSDPFIRQIQKQLKDLQADQEKTRSALSESQQSQDAQAKKLILNEVKMLVDGDETFETIKAMDAHDSVVELIEAVLDEQGILLSIEDAAKEIEEELFNESALKIAGLKKIQSKFAPAQQPQAAGEPQKQVSSQKPNVQTLSNRISDGVSNPMTAKERRERAIMAFKGQLN